METGYEQHIFKDQIDKVDYTDNTAWNDKQKTIKFEHIIWHSNISFLDTFTYKNKNKTLQTTPYRKPTDQQSYLHAYSDHPKSLKKHTV